MVAFLDPLIGAKKRESYAILNILFELVKKERAQKGKNEHE